jgi:hypothetical protein
LSEAYGAEPEEKQIYFQYRPTGIRDFGMMSVSSVVDGEESWLIDGNGTRAGATFIQTGLDGAMGS